jgi:hypothetical protein
MGELEAAVAILLLIAFLGGIVMGVVVVVSLASRREDRRYSLTGDAPDPLCQVTRLLTGASVIGTGFLSDAMGAARDGDESAHGQEPER